MKDLEISIKLLINKKMKYNPQLKADILEYQNYVIIVEGKKDIESLNALGFQRVYAINEPGVPIKIRLENLSKIIKRKENVCILTDFDKKGKELYFLIKRICQQLGMKTDSSLRGILLKAKTSHVEGLYRFMRNQED